MMLMLMLYEINNMPCSLEGSWRTFDEMKRNQLTASISCEQP